jgi:hypothetical protein
VDLSGDLHAELVCVDPGSGAWHTVLGADDLYEDDDLEWSPDGSRLAVLHHPVDPPTAGLLTVAVDGSAVQMVALCENGKDADGLCSSNNGSVAWSPDGGSLAFENYDGSSHAFAVLDLASGTASPISGTRVPGCCLAWQPTK